MELVSRVPDISQQTAPSDDNPGLLTTGIQTPTRSWGGGEQTSCDPLLFPIDIRQKVNALKLLKQ